MKKLITYKKFFVLFLLCVFCTMPASALVRDEFVEETLKNKDFSNTPQIVNAISSEEEIEIRILKPFSTKSKPVEGTYLDFVTVKEVKHKNKTYPAGTPVKARVETVSQNDVWGVPADLVLGNFEMKNVSLIGEVSKTGAKRVLWVRPLAIVSGVFTGAGFFFIFLRGGHAKITPEETYTVYLPK